MQNDCGDILDLLRDPGAGASGDLPALLYDQLRRLARSLLRESAGAHTLQPTALVHEAYVKVFGSTAPTITDRVHFLALMARVMRQVLVDYARARAASKRGGARPLPLDTQAHAHTPAVAGVHDASLLDLNLALDELTAVNPDLGRVVELFYFGGLTAEEIALVLPRSPHVIRHDLRAARAWLRRQLSVPQTGSAD